MLNDFEFEGAVDDLLGDTPQVDTPDVDETIATPVDPDLLGETKNDPEPEPVEPTVHDDYLTKFLAEYGINNGVIMYETDDGTEEVNFHELGDDEKFNILKEISTPNLSKDEINTINFLRSNNATMQDVIEYYSDQAVKDYISKNGPVEKTYAIDDYSDEELYLVDLRNKYSDMSEEDMQSDLENAKRDEELFKKKADLIRKQYKAQEDAEAQEKTRLQEEHYNNFKNSIQEQLNNFAVSVDYTDDAAYKLQIEDNEREAIWNYIMHQDENGMSQFVKDLNSTEKVVEMAWYSLFGKDAMSDIGQYWKSKLKQERKEEKKQTKAKTSVVEPKDDKTRDPFDRHRFSTSFVGGENLL